MLGHIDGGVHFRFGSERIASADKALELGQSLAIDWTAAGRNLGGSLQSRQGRITMFIRSGKTVPVTIPIRFYLVGIDAVGGGLDGMRKR
jgi:hypothetical protein